MNISGNRIEKERLPLYPLIAFVAEEAKRFGFPVYLVGGYVRDVLLGKTSFDLDFVTEGDAHFLAGAFAHLGHVHLDRFGTAHWAIAPDVLRDLGIEERLPPGGEQFTVDFATARTEHYTHSAALPTIDSLSASLSQDLLRRDFTINALALRLSDLTLIECPGGLDDLRAGRVRVLHERSFHDDPTRIFRAARYASRFNFKLDPLTESLIPHALTYIDQLSGERISEEFRRIFDEDDPFAASSLLQDWGVMRQIDASLHVDEKTRDSLQKLESANFVNEITNWCILLYAADAERILKRLELSRLYVDSVLKTQKMVSALQSIPPASQPSLIVQTIEAVENREQINRIVCQAAWAIQPSELLLRYVEEWRNVRPALTGEDLKAAGLRPGPLFGTILDRLRAALLDGDIHTIQEERAMIQQWIRG